MSCFSSAAAVRRRFGPGLLALVTAIACTPSFAQFSVSGFLDRAKEAGEAARAAASRLGSSSASAPNVGTIPKMSDATARLYKQQDVTGEDLYQALTTMRRNIAEQRSAAAWSKASAAIGQAAAQTSSGFDPSKALGELMMKVAIEQMRTTVITVAGRTLDDYLAYLLEDRRGALASETIRLPNPAGMTTAQAETTITMAALIVAARVSGKVLDKAEQDFKSLKVDYEALLTRRERAAELLFATIDMRRMAQRKSDANGRAVAEGDLRNSLSEKDLAFIDLQLNTMSVKDFSKDMAAQNLAIQYLQAKDPSAYRDYRAQADDVVRRTAAYVRTVSGVAAFGALTLTFGHTMGEALQGKDLDSAMLALPLGWDYVRAAAPLFQKSIAVSAAGVDLSIGDSIWTRRNRFAVVRAGNTSEVRQANEVFKAIQEAGVGDQFVGALFLDGSGWLNRVRLCDPEETGRMMDTAVSQKQRSKFAADYLGWTIDPRLADINFATLLANPGPSKREQRAGDDLFARDQRKRFDVLPVSEVQLAVEANYGAWNNEQLMQLVFHNRESGAAYATLQVGDFSVRPLPSPESVYAYESRIESCRKAVDKDIARQASR